MNRALPAAVALVITLVAFGSAFGVNTAIRSFVAPEEGALVAVAGDVGDAQQTTAAIARAPRIRSESEYLHEILSRNIFDMAFIESYNPQKSTGGGGNAQVRTDLKVNLLGTVVASPEKYSSALIAEEGSDRANGYGVGDLIYDAEIIKIEQKVVTIKRGDGRIEQLTMEGERKVASAPTSSATTEGGEGGVEQIGENSYAVDRSLIEQYLQDIEGISKLGRALLHRGPDGEFDGYRLSAIRRGTIADQLGIKNGDVIHSANGQPLNSVQGAMNAYQNLMSEDGFSFEVTRRGQKMTMEYQIR